jgi:hypothetical protein
LEVREFSFRFDLLVAGRGGRFLFQLCNLGIQLGERFVHGSFVLFGRIGAIGFDGAV